MVWSERRKRIAVRFFIGITGLILTGLIASWIVAGRLVSPAPSLVGNPPTDLPAVCFTIDSESGETIAGWHIPADAPNGVVVLLHSLRGSRLSMLDRARLFHTAGYSIVMIDFQAHGESSGNQITLGKLEKHDAQAAVDYARRKHPGEPIGIVGVSLGGASALLSSPLGVDAMILESVFPCIENAIHNRVAAKLGFFSFIPAELLIVQLKPRLRISPSELRPVDYVSKIACPVFFMSGTDDLHTTPFETKQMYDAADAPKKLWMVNKAAHIDLYCASLRQYEKRVIDFLKEHLQINSQLP